MCDIEASRRQPSLQVIGRRERLDLGLLQAGYFKDPITAHGITDASRDAELLARAVVRGSDEALSDYQAVRDELSLPLFQITDEIASYEWDLDTVKKLHVQMSSEMNREVKALVHLVHLVHLDHEPWAAQRVGTALKASA